MVKMRRGGTDTRQGGNAPGMDLVELIFICVLFKGFLGLPALLFGLFLSCFVSKQFGFLFCLF